MGGHGGGGGRSGRSGGGGGGGSIAPETSAMKEITSNYKPVGSIQMAKLKAKQMGVDLKDNSGNVAVANEVNSWIAYRKENGLSVPKTINIDKTRGYADRNAAADFNFHQPNTLHVNPRSNSFGKKGIESAARQEKLGLWESKSVLDHEMGHLLHYQSNPTKYTAMSKTKSNTLSAAAKKGVSEYGKTSNLEFVAEVYSGRVRGKTYSPDVMSQYAKLGGPKV